MTRDFTEIRDRGDSLGTPEFKPAGAGGAGAGRRRTGDGAGGGGGDESMPRVLTADVFAPVRSTNGGGGSGSGAAAGGSDRADIGLLPAGATAGPEYKAF